LPRGELTVKIDRERIGRARGEIKICGVQRRYHDKDCNQEQEIPRQVHETGGFDYTHLIQF
jgi:hypothetical protein